MLIAEAEGGRVFEVTPDSRVVWNFTSRYDDDHIAKISDAERYAPSYAAIARDGCFERSG